jgi:hypothetical protein
MDRTKLNEALEINAQIKRIEIGLSYLKNIKYNELEDFEIKISDKKASISIDALKTPDLFNNVVQIMKAQLESEYAELEVKIKEL